LSPQAAGLERARRLAPQPFGPRFRTLLIPKLLRFAPSIPCGSGTCGEAGVSEEHRRKVSEGGDDVRLPVNEGAGGRTTGGGGLTRWPWTGEWRRVLGAFLRALSFLAGAGASHSLCCGSGSFSARMDANPSDVDMTGEAEPPTGAEDDGRSSRPRWKLTTPA
jgi:hypothetical protein